MSNQCFMVEAPRLDGVDAGDALTLDGPEGHHAVAVKRVRQGERIDLVDGGGRRVRCVVRSTDKSSLEATVEEALFEAPPRVSTVLVQALAKGDRDLQAVEAAVELGVDAVVPWQAERCVVRWQGAKADKGRQKWESTVRSAVKQSRRARAPQVAAALSTPALERWIAGEALPDGLETGTSGGIEPAARLAVVLHEESAEPLGRLLSGWLDAADPNRPLEVLLVVGPEGGIAPDEVERLVAAGAHTALLGRNVLRASTAGPAALVLARHLAGLLEPPTA